MKKFLFILIMLTFAGSSFSIIEIGPIAFNIFRIFFMFFCALHIFNKKPQNLQFSGRVFYKYLFAVFMFFVFLTLAMRFDTAQWLSGFVFLIINIALIYFVVMYSDDMNDVDRYMKAYAIGLLINMIVGVYEYNTQNHIITSNYLSEYLYTDQYYSLSKAPTAFLYNPNNLGVAVVLGVSFGGVLKKQSKKSASLLIKAIWFVLCTYIAFATGSRGAILLIVVAIITYMILERVHTLKKIMGLFLLMITVTVILYANSEFIIKQLQYSGLLSQNTLIDSTIDKGRINTILGGFAAAKNHFFLGTGPMSAEIALYRETGIYFSIHNFWIEWLMTMGIPGMICFLILYFRCIGKMFMSQTYQSKIILTSLIVFFGACMVPPTISTLNFIWLLFGFSIAIEKFDSIEKEKMRIEQMKLKYSGLKK